MKQTGLKREISIGHGVLLLVGCVIGAGAFILTGPLASHTGPGLWLVFLIAAIPALFVAVVFAQLGSAFPVTGATYVSISRLLSPMASSIVVWSVILGIFLFNLPMMAYGFSMYLNILVPVPIAATSIVVLVLFTMVNILGLKWIMWFQSIATGLAIIVLLIFSIGGAPHVNPVYQTPLAPLGIGAVLVAVIPAYCMFTALNAITEVAGETRNPGKNIPVIIFISLLILTLIYVLFSYTLTGLLPWQYLGTIDGPVAAAAGTFLPEHLANPLVSVAVLMASATTINAALTFVSRDVIALSSDGVFPGIFATINSRFGTPVRAVILLGLLSVLGLLLASISSEKLILTCATVTAYVFMLMSMLASISIFLLPRKMPELYSAAGFKLKRHWLNFFTLGGAIIFALLIIAGCVYDYINGQLSALYLFLFILTGMIYYLARKLQLKRKGISIEDRLNRAGEF